jgi:hypothetical protein
LPRDISVATGGDACARELQSGFSHGLEHPLEIHLADDLPRGLGEAREPPARSLSLVLRLLALGDVAHHLGEPAQLTLRVAHGGDGHVGPEARAVLSHALAFFPVLAGDAGDLQLPSGLRREVLVRRKQAGVVPPADLVGAPPGQVLGPGVPADGPSFRVEHDDAVVLHASTSRDLLVLIVERRPIPLLS